MRTIIYLVLIFSLAGSFGKEEKEKIHFDRCTETGRIIFDKPFGKISYQESNTIQSCEWIFTIRDNDTEDILFSLDIFYYSEGSTSNSFLLPNGLKLNSSKIRWCSDDARRLTFYKSKNLFDENPPQNLSERLGKLFKTTRWPPQFVTNTTGLLEQGIQFGLFYRFWVYYPLQNCSLKNRTSGHNCNHSDNEQSHQQLFVGAVIALSGMLTAAIITVFLLLIKLRQLKKILTHPAPNVNEIPVQQRVLEESSFENSFSSTDESSERQMADNLSLPSVHAQ